MNEQLMKGSGIGKKRMPFAARVAACLILIGVLLPAALCVAAQQDPREAAIAADFAAGTNITVIIQNAVAAGLSVERAVQVLVAAGANAGSVVYAAITAGYSASDVVKGAANAVEGMGLSDSALLTQMATIISGATQAGATPAQVNTGLSNAGVPPTVIAGANSLAGSPGQPVYGYTAPPGGTPPTGGGPLGGGGGLIGGSGLGKPPTQPASPIVP